MGRISRCFDSTPLGLLLGIIGIFMAILYFFAFLIDYNYYHGDKPPPGPMNYTVFAVTSYAFAGCINICFLLVTCTQYLCCFFSIYYISVSIAAICSFIDIFIFYPFSSRGVFVYSLTFIASLLSIFIFCLAQSAFRRREESKKIEDYEENGPTVVTSNEDNPKFDMILTVERAEVRDHPETEAMNNVKNN